MNFVLYTCSLSRDSCYMSCRWCSDHHAHLQALQCEVVHVHSWWLLYPLPAHTERMRQFLPLSVGNKITSIAALVGCSRSRHRHRHFCSCYLPISSVYLGEPARYQIDERDHRYHHFLCFGMVIEDGAIVFLLPIPATWASLES
jgi:hypothetical protein